MRIKVRNDDKRKKEIRIIYMICDLGSLDGEEYIFFYTYGERFD